LPEWVLKKRVGWKQSTRFHLLKIKESRSQRPKKEELLVMGEEYEEVAFLSSVFCLIFFCLLPQEGFA